MEPPQTINVLDRNAGFTAIARSKQYVRVGNGWKRRYRECETLWRPGSVLTRGTLGRLDEFNEKSFFQENNNVTKAIYKVAGYGYRIAIWFDNATRERIA